MTDDKKPFAYPDGNPKTRFGIKKPPIWYVPMTAMFMQGLVHLQGALKYGHFNWRRSPISASTYMNAISRHFASWMEGEECAKDSGIHHLAHIAACCNIIIDAQRYGSLIDDRNEAHYDMDKFFEEMAPLVERIHADWGHTKPEIGQVKKQVEPHREMIPHQTATQAAMPDHDFRE